MISATVRHALNTSKVSMYKVSKDTGIASSQLSRFKASKGSLSLANLEKLAGYLNIFGDLRQLAADLARSRAIRESVEPKHQDMLRKLNQEMRRIGWIP